MSTIETVEELDALPVGSVVDDLIGHVYFQHADSDDLIGRGWVCEDGERWTAEQIIEESDLPLTVLHDPTVPLDLPALVSAEREADRHSIVNVTTRGILGGWCHHCSCGTSVNEPEGGSEAVDAHLAGPPSPRRPGPRERIKALVSGREADRLALAAARAEVERLRVLWDKSGKNDLIAERDRARADLAAANATIERVRGLVDSLSADCTYHEAHECDPAEIATAAGWKNVDDYAQDIRAALDGQVQG